MFDIGDCSDMGKTFLKPPFVHAFAAIEELLGKLLPPP